MNVRPLAIAEVLEIRPRIFGDSRGFFYESFNLRKFSEQLPETEQTLNFVQDNHSQSVRGVLRGIHYQLPPFAQGKLVRVTRGEVYDVAVDLRRHSPSFGQWVGLLLSSSEKNQLWIPPGFGHAFLCLSDEVEFLYKTTDYYQPSAERCIRWDDPELAITWPETGNALKLSAKDLAGVSFNSAEYFP